MSRPVGGRSSPEASGAMRTLRPEAHQRRLMLFTWLSEKEAPNTSSVTTCSLGTAVFTNAKSFWKSPG